MSTSKHPPLGADSFWEMAVLAMTGELASCESCVEHYYFQSWPNARQFLDACAAGGLVDRISLLDLQGHLGSRLDLSPSDLWYDQAIYISAPEFRKRDMTTARQRIENTRRAVYEAFHLFHVDLRADKGAIDNSYHCAIRDNLLRYSHVARERIDVDLSAVAKLRLILDGFRKQIKDQQPGSSKAFIERQATVLTVDFVRTNGAVPMDLGGLPARSDRAAELITFVLGFLADRAKVERFWALRISDTPLPRLYEKRWAHVLLELASSLRDRLLRSQRESDAEEMANRFEAALLEAQENCEEVDVCREIDSTRQRWAHQSLKAAA